MKAFFLCLFWGLAYAAKPQSVQKVAFSGGGIRAAIGALVADFVMEAAFDSYEEVHGASGGAWGLSFISVGNLAHTCEHFQPSAAQKKVGPESERGNNQWPIWRSGVTHFLPLRGDLDCYKTVVNLFRGAEGEASKRAFIHVSPTDVDDNELVDCWWSNEPRDNWGCAFNHLADNRPENPAWGPDHDYRVRSLPDPPMSLVDALTYTSAAWSTSEAKRKMGRWANRFYSRPPPWDGIEGQEPMKLTDGGGYLNLPIVSMVLDWLVTPADTLIYAFDYSAPDEGKDYQILNVLRKVNARMEEVTLIADFFDLANVAEDVCFTTLTKAHEDGNHHLWIRVFGFCGPANNRRLIREYPTITSYTAKRWTQTEMQTFITRYGGFLKETFEANFITVALNEVADKEKLKGVVTVQNIHDLALPACVWGQAGFVESNATLKHHGSSPIHHTRRKRHHKKHVELLP